MFEDNNIKTFQCLFLHFNYHNLVYEHTEFTEMFFFLFHFVLKAESLKTVLAIG